MYTIYYTCLLIMKHSLEISNSLAHLKIFSAFILYITDQISHQYKTGQNMKFWRLGSPKSWFRNQHWVDVYSPWKFKILQIELCFGKSNTRIDMTQNTTAKWINLRQIYTLLSTKEEIGLSFVTTAGNEDTCVYSSRDVEGDHLPLPRINSKNG